jgi:hypothetical protein
MWVCGKTCADHGSKCHTRLYKNNEGKLEPHFGSCWCSTCEREDRDSAYR